MSSYQVNSIVVGTDEKEMADKMSMIRKWNILNLHKYVTRGILIYQYSVQ